MIERWWQSAWAPWAAIVAGALVGALAFNVGEPQGEFRPIYGDLDRAYYPMAKAAAYDQERFFHYYSGPTPLIVTPPITGHLFRPIAWMTQRDAERTFLITGLIAIALAAWGLVTVFRIPWPRGAMVVALLLSNGPMWNSVREANTSHILLPILVGFAGLYAAGFNAVLAAPLLFCVLAKTQLASMVGLLVLGKRWWGAVLMVLGVLGLAALSWYEFGPDLNAMWYRQCVKPFSGKPMAAYNVQSVDGVLARFWLGPAALEDWSPHEMPSLFYVLRYSVMLTLAASVGLCMRNEPADEHRRHARLLEAAAFCQLAVLTSPASWTHYHCIGMICVAAIMADPFALSTRKRMRWFIAALILVWPPVFLLRPHERFLAYVHAAIIQSHYWAGSVILGAFVVDARNRLGIEAPSWWWRIALRVIGR